MLNKTLQIMSFVLLCPRDTFSDCRPRDFVIFFFRLFWFCWLYFAPKAATIINLVWSPQMPDIALSSDKTISFFTICLFLLIHDTLVKLADTLLATEKSDVISRTYFRACLHGSRASQVSEVARSSRGRKIAHVYIQTYNLRVPGWARF